MNTIKYSLNGGERMKNLRERFQKPKVVGLRKHDWVKLQGSPEVGVISQRRGRVTNVQWPNGKTRVHTTRFLFKVSKRKRGA